jgi:hypothetical protein
MVKGAIEARDRFETPAVEKARKRLLEKFAGSFFQTRVEVDHKIQGTVGEEKILLKTDAVQVKQKNVPYSRERILQG